MLFNSWIFAAFLLVFIGPYLLLRQRIRARNVWLLIASYLFYGWWNPRFVTLLAVLAVVDYMAARGVSGISVTSRDRRKGLAFIGITTACLAPVVDGDVLFITACMAAAAVLIIAVSLLIPRYGSRDQSRWWLRLSILANLGILGFFKYYNFFVENVHAALAALGMDVSAGTLDIVLPIGLSFHVFQGISRTVDCYRGVVRPDGSLISVATYLAFFPQLVAGPIERAARLMPQFEVPRVPTRQQVGDAALLFLWGLFQKVVVADSVAPVADRAFRDWQTIDSATAFAGILAFTVQIYGDFCGYSNMARGLARALGFDLMANFNLPYFSRTPSEFWRRWHISLSSWLRDYLYIGLGGNRHGEVARYRNLVLTMLLGGLWHGASWTFVAWGAWHGLLLVVYRVTRVDDLIGSLQAGSLRATAVNGVSWLATMIFVMIGWVFFRAESFRDAGGILLALGRSEALDYSALWLVLGYAMPLFMVEVLQRVTGVYELTHRKPFLLRYSVALVIVLSVFLFGASSGQRFIYFDF